MTILKKNSGDHTKLCACLLMAALALSGLQIYMIKQANELDNTAIIYSVWKADKAEYTPGELMHFSYALRIIPQPGNEAFLIRAEEIFQNETTGEVLPGIRTFRLVRASRNEKLNATRRIPVNCTSGSYTMQGVANAQTSRLSKTTGYSSDQFKVKAKESEQP